MMTFEEARAAQKEITDVLIAQGQRRAANRIGHILNPHDRTNWEIFSRGGTPWERFEGARAGGITFEDIENDFQLLREAMKFVWKSKRAGHSSQQTVQAVLQQPDLANQDTPAGTPLRQPFRPLPDPVTLEPGSTAKTTGRSTLLGNGISLPMIIIGGLVLAIGAILVIGRSR